MLANLSHFVHFLPLWAIFGNISTQISHVHMHLCDLSSITHTVIVPLQLSIFVSIICQLFWNYHWVQLFNNYFMPAKSQCQCWLNGGQWWAIIDLVNVFCQSIAEVYPSIMMGLKTAGSTGFPTLQKFTQILAWKDSLTWERNGQVRLRLCGSVSSRIQPAY